MYPRFDRRLTMPAGRVLGVIVIALLIATLFNSEAIVRAGEGMDPGTTRDIVLSIGRPLDDAAGAVGLHLPRDGLDLAFGHDPKTGSGTELEEGSTAILRRRSRRSEPAGREYRQPTTARPLELLVTGDSEALFVGEQLVDQGPADLFEVETVARNGTGLTNPAFFNWELNAEQEIEARDPDAVVMAIGGNDGFNVEVDGELYGPHDPEWETEYARRVAVVMRELSENGRRPVYWVPPPTARDDEFNAIYAAQNRAVEQAAQAVPGARYVDIYNTINDGKYSDELTIDGRRVLARQSDGVHFTRDGAVLPTRLIFRRMAMDYPVLDRQDGP
ncbi:MAG TPA: GDSL-type esterase/lipase family protein [Thermoleophilaceae bacterium]|nr:GDSL-type esterase/lipase family protein [Thermoleophilaceae bacterium]